MLGPFRFEKVHARRGVGQSDAAHMVKPAGLSRDLLQLLIELDGVTLQRRHVGIGIEGVESRRPHARWNRR